MLVLTSVDSALAENVKSVSPSTSVALNSILKDSPSWIVWLGIGVTIGLSLIDTIFISKVPTSSSAGSGNSNSTSYSEQFWKEPSESSIWQLS